MPELFNNVVHERGGRIRAHASKWDSLRDELGAAKTSFGMSLGDPLGKNAASAGPKVSTEATRGDGETADDTPPATGKAAKPAEELEELLMSKMRTTRPTGETKKSQQPAKAKKEEPKKEKKDAFSAAVEIKAKEREEKEKRDKNKTTKRKDEKDETKRVLAFEKKDWTRTVVEGAEVLFLCAAGGIKAAQAFASRRELAARSTKRSVARNGTATVAVAASPTPARPPPAAIAQLGWAADGALIGALAASAFLRRTGASNNVVGRVVEGSVAVAETPASVGVGAESAPVSATLSAPASAPVVDPADLESVIARVRAKSRRLRDELSNSRVEAAKAAEAAVKAAAASPGSSAVEPDKLKDVLKAVNLALEEKDEMEKAVQLQKAAMEAHARAEAAERIAKDNAERAKMAEEREEKIADRFSKEADRALESLRYLSSLKDQQSQMETWTTETTVRRTGPGPFPRDSTRIPRRRRPQQPPPPHSSSSSSSRSSSSGLTPSARVRIGDTSKLSTWRLAATSRRSGSGRNPTPRSIPTTRKTFGAACDSSRRLSGAAPGRRPITVEVRRRARCRARCCVYVL